MNNVKLSWIDPTVLSDGTTAIPTGDIAYIDLSRSDDGGKTFTDLGHVAPGVEAFVDTNVPAGDHVYSAVVVDSQNTPLDSAPVTTTITVPATLAAPGPVTALTATLA